LAFWSALFFFSNFSPTLLFMFIAPSMRKFGDDFENNISAAKKAKAEAKESFDAIVARFKWAQEHEEAPITNRTKLLIKNMF